jgi:hypothetical protein
MRSPISVQVRSVLGISSCDNRDVGKWGRFVLILAGTLALAVAAMAGLAVAVLRDVRTGDPAVQGAVVGAVAGVGGGVLGALIGAGGAFVVAHVNREEAREARFASRLRELSLQLMEDVLGVGLELTQQVAARAGASQPVDTDGLPKVRDTIAIRRRLLELDLTARSQPVSDAARELVGCLERIRDDFGYSAPRDMEVRRSPKRQVLAKPLTPTAGDDLTRRIAELDGRFWKFQEAVRQDLGLRSLGRGAASQREQGE